MRGILADVNIEGHLARIVAVFLESPEWIEFWSELELTVESFERLGFDPNTPDDEIWRTCQQEGLVLVTTNRNSEGPTSLESVMRNENTPLQPPNHHHRGCGPRFQRPELRRNSVDQDSGIPDRHADVARLRATLRSVTFRPYRPF